jgi:hypothetical protein
VALINKIILSSFSHTAEEIFAQKKAMVSKKLFPVKDGRGMHDPGQLAVSCCWREPIAASVCRRHCEKQERGRRRFDAARRETLLASYCLPLFRHHYQHFQTKTIIKTTTVLAHTQRTCFKPSVSLTSLNLCMPKITLTSPASKALPSA